jgi:polysaccharide biosynthesis protein PslE
MADQSRNAQDDASPPGWAKRPRLSLTDLLVMLWREKWLILLVSLLIFGPLAYFAIKLPRTYEASSNLIVLLGQEYVYQPRVGDAARGAIPKTEEFIQSELELLRSPAIADRVIEKIGVGKVYPEVLKAAERAPPEERQQVIRSARVTLLKHFATVPSPNSSVIRTGFQHKNPEMAALVLNTLIDEYLSYRKTVLIDTRAEPLKIQKEAFVARLAEADAAIDTFLKENGLADFDTARTSASTLTQALTDQALQAEARRRETETRARSLRAKLDATPSEISLYTESNLRQRLLDLQAERRALLARYKPESRPVQDIDRRIAEVQAFLAEEAAGQAGSERRGPNPVRQELETQVSQAEAEARAATEREIALKAQLTDTNGRLADLQRLQPAYQALLRDRALVEQGARDFATREQEARANQELASQASDNIRVIERATPPPKGRSLRLPAVVLGFGFAGFTGLMVGLLRALSRRGFQTAASARRTLGLPVLAVLDKR